MQDEAINDGRGYEVWFLIFLAGKSKFRDYIIHSMDEGLFLPLTRYLFVQYSTYKTNTYSYNSLLWYLLL